MSTPSWSTSRPVLERWRRFFWRARWPLAIVYLLGLTGLAGGVHYYRRYVSRDLDLGATIAIRSWAYQRTFEPVEQARDEVQRGLVDRAVSRLESFLDSHANVQASQLHTHAVTDASELLAELYRGQDRLGRARRVLEAAVERTPLNYWLWYQLGLLEQERGDLAAATAALRQAFQQTLVHPVVAEEYVSLLAEQNLLEDLVWAADHFERARDRVRPFVQARAGAPRDPLQRRVLNLAGIPIEQGRFTRIVQVNGLDRGRDRVLELPRELFNGLPVDQDVFLLLRFQNVFEGLQVTGLAARLHDGTTVDLPAGPDRTETMHRAHSGGDWYVELRTRLPEQKLTGVVVTYSCPEAAFSEAIQEMVQSATRNLAARETRR